jgi:hypothetical protein
VAASRGGARRDPDRRHRNRGRDALGGAAGTRRDSWTCDPVVRPSGHRPGGARGRLRRTRAVPDRHRDDQRPAVGRRGAVGCLRARPVDGAGAIHRHGRTDARSGDGGRPAHVELGRRCRYRWTRRRRSRRRRRRSDHVAGRDGAVRGRRDAVVARRTGRGGVVRRGRGPRTHHVGRRGHDPRRARCRGDARWERRCRARSHRSPSAVRRRRMGPRAGRPGHQSARPAATRRPGGLCVARWRRPAVVHRARRGAARGDGRRAAPHSRRSSGWA